MRETGGFDLCKRLHHNVGSTFVGSTMVRPDNYVETIGKVSLDDISLLCDVDGDHENTDKEVGTIFFVCMYVLYSMKLGFTLAPSENKSIISTT